MPPKTIDDQIQSHIEDFVEELTALVRAAAVESVEAALGASAKTPSRRAAAPRAKVAGRPKGGRRAKRTTAQVNNMAERVLDYVKSNPGLGVEHISKGLGVKSKDLKLPIQTLLESGKLKTTGQRRGTKYFEGKGGVTKPAAVRNATKKSKTSRKTKRRAKRSKTAPKAA